MNRSCELEGCDGLITKPSLVSAEACAVEGACPGAAPKHHANRSANRSEPIPKGNTCRLKSKHLIRLLHMGLEEVKGAKINRLNRIREIGRYKQWQQACATAGCKHTAAGMWIFAASNERIGVYCPR